MRLAAPALLAAMALTIAPALGQNAEPIRIELNVLDNLQDRCRATFVIENKSQSAIESLALDLAVFNPEGIVQRRLALDLAPLRPAKTMVKAFELEGLCARIGALLVNDVTACVPGTPDACLARLELSSRPDGVRFYK
jgi:hypothetical protein